MNRRLRLLVACVAAVLAGIVAAAVGAQYVAAWGNGCIDGQRFPNEHTYYAYLDTHPNADIGACPGSTTSTSSTSTTTAPTTSTTTTASSSTIATPAPSSTSSSTGSTPPSWSVRSTSVSQPPGSTSSTWGSLPDLPPIDMTCNENGMTPDQIGDRSLSNTCSESPKTTPTSGSSGPTSLTGSSTNLPATGRNPAVTGMAAVGALALGAALVSIARRKEANK